MNTVYTDVNWLDCLLLLPQGHMIIVIIIIIILIKLRHSFHQDAKTYV